MSLFGESVTLTVEFGVNGVLYDPFDVDTVDILDPSDTVMNTLAPVRISTGRYAVTYTVPAAGPAGTWKHRWTYTAESGMSAHTFTYSFAVTAWVPGTVPGFGSFPHRWNPMPIQIRFLNHTSAVAGSLLDSDFGQVAGGASKPLGLVVELQAQVVYRKDKERTFTWGGDTEVGDGHLTFTEDYLTDEGYDPLGSGDKIKIGDHIVSIAGNEVDYKIIEVRPSGHLKTRGNTPMLWMAFFEYDKETKARV